jgi:hypothetical protein
VTALNRDAAAAGQVEGAGELPFTATMTVAKRFCSDGFVSEIHNLGQSPSGRLVRPRGGRYVGWSCH